MDNSGPDKCMTYASTLTDSDHDVSLTCILYSDYREVSNTD